MLLNSFERFLMNNPVRSLIQRFFETRRLLEMGGPASGQTVLEIGCGRGVGIENILRSFGAGRVDAFDLDPRMVDLARRRTGLNDDRVRLWVGDAENIRAEDETYDAVFDYGIIHHLPDWRRALGEVRRVLKPGGRFYAEEVLIKPITSRLWRRLFDHPQEDRFSREGFRRALEETGFSVLSEKNMLDYFAWFVADKR